MLAECLSLDLTFTIMVTCTNLAIFLLTAQYANKQMCTFSWKIEKPECGLHPVGCHSALFGTDHLVISPPTTGPQHSVHTGLSIYCSWILDKRDMLLSQCLLNRNSSSDCLRRKQHREHVHTGVVQGGSATWWLRFFFKVGRWHQPVCIVRTTHCDFWTFKRTGKMSQTIRFLNFNQSMDGF